MCVLELPGDALCRFRGSWAGEPGVGGCGIVIADRDDQGQEPWLGEPGGSDADGRRRCGDHVAAQHRAAQANGVGRSERLHRDSRERLRERFRERAGIHAATVLAVMAWPLACAPRATGPISFAGATMGTTYLVRVSGLPGGRSRESMAGDVAAIAERIDATMSTYRPTSDVARFNARRDEDWAPVSDEVVTVVEEALALGRLSGGAFDITVGPLVDLWGFGPTVRPPVVPLPAALVAARARVGQGRLDTRRSPPALRKRQADIEIDLSGIAKGYAVDSVAEHLTAVGVSDFLVEIGGEVRAAGTSPEGGPWRVGIEQPPGTAVAHVVNLAAGALATSGDYRSFFEQDGARYSHAIDPRSGWPARHDLASVSVLDASTARADGLATTFMVLGPEAGRALAEREGIPVLFVIREGDGFREETTPAMRAALAGAPVLLR